MHDYKSIRLDRNQARKLISEIVRTRPENVWLTPHSLSEARNDGLTNVDIWNVLESPSAKLLDEPEIKNGTWRYRLSTNFILLVIEFTHEGDGLCVITVWDRRKKG